MSGIGNRTCSGGISCIPAGVGGASVTPGVGTTEAACPHPANTTTVVSSANSLDTLITSGLFFARALITGCLFFARALITGTH
ncbi:hypothetical protein NIIDNTM18_05880 [Mycolicibacterium litorale]|uniref:Uncharacterized protein n=1 Tax=Mycolicibacterium litorale TaxID=758802 RepID=A0A6S6P3P8_9MYCO|nr:hypothetical protein NIIDNTM18_05880 [Mycolicibacterium litorale]